MIGQKGLPARYGGVERHVEELAKELAQQGQALLVYARRWYTAGAKFVFPGIEVVPLPTVHTKHLDTIGHTFLSTLHALWRGADIIHYHGVGPALLSWLPRLLSPRTRVVVTFHTIDRYHQKWNWLARLALKAGEWAACTFPHVTIAVSKTIQKYCLNEYYKNTVYIPNGVSLPQSVLPAAALPAVGLTAGKYLLMVARLVPHKGAHYLIEAWQFARAQYPELLQGYQLVIVGDSVFTDQYVAELHGIAAGDPTVVFTGWQYGEALSALYAHAALVVHPSENEGLSLSVLEGMAYGRAVLISDIPENQELVADERFAFVNASIASLADHIITLLHHPEWLAAAGHANAATVRRRFRWTDIARATVAVYTTSPPAHCALRFSAN